MAARSPALRDLGRMVLLGVLGVAAPTTFTISRSSEPMWRRPSFCSTRRPSGYCSTWSLGAGKRHASGLRAVALAVMGIALVIRLFGSGGLRLERIGVTAACSQRFLSFLQRRRARHWCATTTGRCCCTPPSARPVLDGDQPAVEDCRHPLFWQTVALPVVVLAGLRAGSVSSTLPACHYLDPTRAIVVSCLEPVFSIVIAAIALRETVRPLQAAGIALVVGAAILVVQMPDEGIGRTGGHD